MCAFSYSQLQIKGGCYLLRVFLQKLHTCSMKISILFFSCLYGSLGYMNASYKMYELRHPISKQILRHSRWKVNKKKVGKQPVKSELNSHSAYEQTHRTSKIYKIKTGKCFFRSCKIWWCKISVRYANEYNYLLSIDSI